MALTSWALAATACIVATARIANAEQSPQAIPDALLGFAIENAKPGTIFVKRANGVYMYVVRRAGTLMGTSNASAFKVFSEVPRCPSPRPSLWKATTSSDVAVTALKQGDTGAVVLKGADSFSYAQFPSARAVSVSVDAHGHLMSDVPCGSPPPPSL